MKKPAPSDTTRSFPFVPHGGDYNPEQWPPAVWEEDVRLMRRAHVNLPTLPVFGGPPCSPTRTRSPFEWLDRVLDLLHENGVRACLATATAATPPWVDQKYPDILRVDVDGRRRRHGGRHTFCPHSPNFRRLSTGLARRIAERYAEHPAVAPVARFQRVRQPLLLRPVRRGVPRLTAKPVRQPRRGERALVHRVLGPDLHRLVADRDGRPRTASAASRGCLSTTTASSPKALLDCFRAEADVLREITPGVPITTNLMGTFKPLDYHRWARAMDVVSWDSYPRKDARPCRSGVPAFRDARPQGGASRSC
jgi:beta-galactosidase